MNVAPMCHGLFLNRGPLPRRVGRTFSSPRTLAHWSAPSATRAQVKRIAQRLLETQPARSALPRKQRPTRTRVLPVNPRARALSSGPLIATVVRAGDAGDGSRGSLLKRPRARLHRHDA